MLYSSFLFSFFCSQIRKAILVLKMISCNICLVCIIKPVCKISSKFLVFQVSCKHSALAPFSEPFEIRRPKLHRCVLFFFIAVFLLGFSLTIALLKPICIQNEGDCLHLLSNSILVLPGIWVTREVLDKLHHWLGEINKWSHILDDLAKENTLLEQLQMFSASYHHTSLVVMVLMILQILILMVICVISVSKKKMNFIIAEVTLSCTTFIQIAVFTTIMIVAFIIKELFRIIGNFFCRQLEKGEDLNDCIKKYKKHLWSASYTWRKLNETVKPSAVTCLIFYIVVIILNIYSLIIESKDMSLEKIFISCYRISTVGFILFYTITALDQERMVSIGLFYLHLTTRSGRVF